MSESSFLSVLLDDVRMAHTRHSKEDSQSSRRDLVRTVFAAIDGLAWSYREFVRENLSELGYVRPDEELALAELSYTVDRSGVVSQQRKYISTPSAIRLSSRIVERAHPDLKFDFSHQGWSDFLQSTETRNRITHPKSCNDLEINDAELLTCLEAFYWLMELVTFGMERCLDASKAELEWTKGFVQDLNNGDPRAWADYLAAEKSLDEGN